MALAPFFSRQSGGGGFSDPFSSLEKQMLGLFDRSGEIDHPAHQFAKEVSAVANTRIDWCETPEAHILKADVPGLNKEEIKIQLEDNKVLQISGERKKEDVQKTDTWHRVERSHGRFLRRFWLPEDAQVDAISAKVDNGVLTVTLPKIDKAATENRMISLLKK